MTTATKYKTYPKYKPSGIDWLGDIPVEWEAKRFRFLANLQKGRKPEENTESANNGLPYLTMDFLRGQEEPTRYAPAQESVVVDDGEILLLWDGANAGEFVKGSKGILSSTMAKVSFSPKLNPKYYFYFLASFEKKLRELTIGMGIPHVSGDIVKDCLTPIPPELEQKFIADFLDRETAKIDEMMEKVETQIEKLQEYRQALITSAVTGKIKI
jgi:type I restriction enzyme, S subunit